MPETAIRIRGVSKHYLVASEKRSTLKEAVIGLFQRSSRQQVEAIKRIDLEVAKGEMLGIIGRNGAGKSTLLKMISGVTKPTTGTIEVNGSLMALIELGAGFQSELSGVENVFLNGAILGLSDGRITEMLPRIVEFSGLGNFIYSPVKHYSSGMVLRLGFSIAAHIQPNIILLDENLSVGDAAFQAKCIAKIQELRQSGTTILMVTHQLDVAEWLCDRVVWLQDGVIAGDGPPSDTLKQYERMVAETEITPWDSRIKSQVRQQLLRGRFGTGEVLIRQLSLLDEMGEPRHVISEGQKLSIRMELEAMSAIPNLNIEFNIVRDDYLPVLEFNLKLKQNSVRIEEGAAVAEVEIPYLQLRPGRYYLNAGLSPDNDESVFYDTNIFMYHFRVKESRPNELNTFFTAPGKAYIRVC